MSIPTMRYSYSPYKATCPVCNNTYNKLLYKISAADAATQFLVNQEQTDSDNKFDIVKNNVLKLWKRDDAAIVSCTHCGFGFADPFVAGDQEFYNLISHIKGETDADVAAYWKWEFDVTFKKIEVLAAKNKNLQVLEIGASTGSFARRVSELVTKQNIFCLEYSNIGVKNINEFGIEARNWDFRELPLKNGFNNRFDVICLFQVLEHLDNLTATFETFNAIIKPGGHLFIAVPNGKKINFNELNDALLDLPPNHVGRYNEQSFKILGNKHKWQLKEISIEPYEAIDVMKTVMYSQSLKRAQYPPVKRTLWYAAKEYVKIKYLQIQAAFKHKQLGEALWVHYYKTE